MSGPAKAASLKQQGNKIFSGGDMIQAAKLYAEAEEADSLDPVYPSNLSAALYEAGDYASCIDAILRAWKLLSAQPDSKPDLLARLSTRLAKALCHGARAKTVTLAVLQGFQDEVASLWKASFDARQEASNANAAGDGGDLTSAWKVWDEERSWMQDVSGNEIRERDALSTLPILTKSLDNKMAYFPMGMDKIIDLVDGWGPMHPHSLHINRMSSERLSNISFMLGGIGDARHLFGTLCGLHAEYKRLADNKKANFRVHITALDHHNVMLTRDLTVLMLLHQLNTRPGAVEQDEIQATLMYVYCGMVMPQYCFERLQDLWRDLRARLSAAPPRLPSWLHVVPNAIPAVTAVLDFWLCLTKSTRRLLEGHEHKPPVSMHGRMAMLSQVQGLSPAYQRMLLQSLQLNDPADPTPEHETVWYRTTKAFCPPAQLRDRHPSFSAAWNNMKAGRKPSTSVERQIVSEVMNDWKPNLTLFDFNLADGYPKRRQDMFETVKLFDDFIQSLIRTRKRHSRETYKPQDAAQICAAFFTEVAAALKALEEKITIEIVCGGLSEELVKMQMSTDSHRAEGFPRTYTRMWLSNVPDYTHGPLGTFVYSIPALQDDSHSAAACNCLVNAGAWQDEAEFFYTYTLLREEDIPRYLGCKVVGATITGVQVYSGFTLPRPLSELATRKQLTTWITGLLFNTLLSAQPPQPPITIRLPHNLAAFFHLLIHLHHVGYPGHWLSDFLARVMSGSLQTKVAPYNGVLPMCPSERSTRVPPRSVRTDPWIPELEAIIARTRGAMPFPLPTTPAAEDVVLWRAPLTPSRDLDDALQHGLRWGNAPCAQLLVYRGDAADVLGARGALRRVFEGAPSPPPGSFFVLGTLEFVQYDECVRFWLSRARVERMRRENGWKLVLCCNDASASQSTRYLVASRPVPIIEWAEWNA